MQTRRSQSCQQDCSATCEKIVLINSCWLLSARKTENWETETETQTQTETQTKTESRVYCHIQNENSGSAQESVSAKEFSRSANMRSLRGIQDYRECSTGRSVTWTVVTNDLIGALSYGLFVIHLRRLLHTILTANCGNCSMFHCN